MLPLLTSPSTAIAAVPLGRRSLGRYTLSARLARGGMAEIFLGQAPGPDARRVVIKCVRPELAHDRDLLAMLASEARLAAGLRHDHICRTFGLEEAGGQTFIVMEYLDGLPFPEVAATLPTTAGLDLGMVAALVAQAAEGLHHAHTTQDMVHRDVSPANLFVTADGVLKVLDFGIAKVAGAFSLTRPGARKGKLAYMSPEYLDEAKLDRRADVFSLGIVLWEAVAGRPLFLRKGRRATIAALTSGPIPRLREVRPDVPAALSDAVARALERDRDARFATARDFGEAVQRAVAALGGLPAPAEIAAWLRDRCGAAIDARRGQIARAEASAPTAVPADPLAAGPETEIVTLGAEDEE